MSSWRNLKTADWVPLLERAGVGGEAAERLATFVVLLGRFQEAANLVGRVDAARLVREHVLESWSGVGLLPERGRMLDLGSGNGFPAIPLLVGRPGVGGVLLEPRERRWAFLREVVRELALDADVRRETAADHGGGGYDAATVRALAEREWAQSLARRVGTGGRLLWWGGSERAHIEGFEPVLTSPLPAPERGVIAVWRRRST